MRLPILALALSLPAAAMAQEAMMNVTYACANDRTLQASFINAGDESFAVIFEAGALVPLRGGERAFGLLVLGSPDPTRYSADMGTDFLMRIGELSSAALARLLPAPQAG